MLIRKTYRIRPKFSRTGRNEDPRMMHAFSRAFALPLVLAAWKRMRRRECLHRRFLRRECPAFPVSVDLLSLSAFLVLILGRPFVETYALNSQLDYSPLIVVVVLRSFPIH
jgi:hypothetical protein